MTRTRWVGVGLLILWAAGSAGVEAHTHLLSSVPRDGSRLAAAPASITLEFSEAARLTALWVERAGGEKQRMRPSLQEARTRITIALPALTPGDYVISWRVVGADGHVLPGRLRFTLGR